MAILFFYFFWLNRFKQNFNQFFMKKYLRTIFLTGVFMTMLASAEAEITLIADPKVLAIPLGENHEPMVDLRKQNLILLGPSPELENNTDYFWMRESVYDKLAKAQAALPKPLHFCLYEAYRSLNLQKFLFETHYANLQKLNPDFSPHQLFLATIKLVSPVVNEDGSKNIPPHSTGAAIDVYLVDEQGVAVDMGIHPKDWMLDHDGSLSLTDSKLLSKEAKKNRAIMSKALLAQGFVNYPTEYWHWSYGDRYWAFMEKQPQTLYSSVLLKE